MPRTQSSAVCIACGSEGEPLYNDLRDNLFAAAGCWRLKRCRNGACGSLWLDPMPVAEDLHLLYSEYYTHGDPARSASYNLGKRVYRFAVDALLSILGIPAERRRAQLMYLQDRRPGSLLDVGCGQGHFIAELARRGWTVSGVDFDPAAVEAARTQYQLDVQVGTIQDIVNQGSVFDVVTASHVIEHVPDPIDFIAQCKRLLRPGGILILRTPNVGSLGHRIYGSAWRGLEPPRHLHLFTISALQACARKAGFASARCFTTSVGAETILLASHFLRKKGEFRVERLTKAELLRSKLVGPLQALWAKAAWLRDKHCGEELFAVMSERSTGSVQ